MESDPVFQYAKLIIESFSIWPPAIILGVWWLWRHPEALRSGAEYIKTLKIGNFEIEMREIKEKLAETEMQVNVLENEIARESARFQDLLSSFNPHAPVSEMASVREALKSMGPSLNDLSQVHKGFAPGASAAEIYAAAEVARSRRDVSLFDELVSCLNRLSNSPNLMGIRRHTVWTLTSALHRTLVADIKHRRFELTIEQLTSAQVMLEKLVLNPVVLDDRPDAPLKGIRGPAKWAAVWIERRLAMPDMGEATRSKK